MELPTHALTLWRPWAWAIIHGPKRVENRSWKPPVGMIGKRIGIHAGSRIDPDAAEWIADEMGLKELPPEACETGLIGSARLVGVVDDSAWGAGDGWEGVKLITGAWGGVGVADLRSWFSGPYGWLLDEVEAFPEPIPMKGAQGLWRVGFVPADALIAAGLK